jgi:hypothetical protein
MNQKLIHQTEDAEAFSETATGERSNLKANLCPDFVSGQKKKGLRL